MIYPKHDKALAYARHCIGVHETSSNRGPIQVTNSNGGVDFFQQHDFVNGVGYPWCASFWLTCWDIAGKPFPYKSPSAYALGNYAQKQGWARSVTSLIPGDGCVWNVGAGHISMFESYDMKTGLVHTIDGNSNNRVMRVARPISKLRIGFHVPETGVAPPAPKPYWVIATSVNGKRKLLFSKFATEKTVMGLLPKMFAKWGVNGITIKRGKPKPK